MTEPPLPPPGDRPIWYAPPQPRALPTSYWAWAIITFCVLLIASAHFVQPAPRGRGPAAAAPGIKPPDAQLLLAGKYVVGVKASTPAGGSQLVAQMRKLATTPADMLRVAIVAGEVDGASSALGILDSTTPDNPQLQLDTATLRELYSEGPQALTREQYLGLVEDHGWFGRLAMVYQAGPDDPLRISVISEARRSFLTLAGGIGLALVGLAVGAVLLIIALVLWANRKIKIAYAPPATTSPAFLEGFAIYIGGFLLVSLLLRVIFGELSLAASWIGAAPVIVAVYWPVLRGVGFAEVRHALGWHAGRGVLVEVGSGLLGYVTALPILGLGVLIKILLTRLAPAAPTHPVMEEIGRGWVGTLEIYLRACVWAPLSEETLFRGMLFSHLRRRHQFIFSAMTVALIFAAIHPQGWVAIPMLSLIALVLATIREWRGSILAPVAAHALNNFIAVTLITIMGA